MIEPAELASTTPRAGQFLAAKLQALDDRLGQVGDRFVRASDDEEACHDLRVALRRTRVLLEAGRKVLGRFRADEVRAALRDLQRATGALRDEEVLLGVIASLGVDRPDIAAWLEARKRRERALRRHLVRCVQAGDLLRGRRLLDALLAFRVDPRRDRRLPKFARKAVERARRGVDRRRGARIDDPTALHDLRIATKRLRYTAEAFADGLPADLAAIAPGAARMQGRLGDLHDVDVATLTVRRARALTPEGRGQLLVALGRLRAERVAAYAKEAGIAPAPPAQELGAEALRKISTR
jgi:CHAD domain-containing protein